MNAALLTRIFLAGVVFSQAAMAASPVPAPQWWRPAAADIVQWDIQLSTPPEARDVPEGLDLIILDLFDTPKATVKALQKRGIRVVCYLNAGAWEDWRDDADDFPRHLLGAKYEGWHGEKWLDIRHPDLRPLLLARLDLCRDKGFDGVDPDNINGFENKTGFPIISAKQSTFNRWLAGAAHERGLAIGLKNTTRLAPALVADYDWILTESCVAEKWCQQTNPFRSMNKPVLAIEYPKESGIDVKAACRDPANRGIRLLFKGLALGPGRVICPKP
jgi:hypothetical protein